VDGQGTLAVPADAHVVVDPRMQVLRRLPIIGTCEVMEAEREAQQQ